MNYTRTAFAAMAFIGVCAFGYNRVSIPERVAATGVTLERGIISSEDAARYGGTKNITERYISRENWQEFLGQFATATQKIMNEKDELLPAAHDLPGNTLFRQMPPEYGMKVVLTETDSEEEDYFGEEKEFIFDYNGIVPGRISLDYTLNLARISFRLPGEMETVSPEGEVTQTNELTFKGMDVYTLPQLWEDLFPIFDEQALRLNVSFVDLLDSANLDFFEVERRRLLAEYTHRVCRVFDLSGAVPETYSCSGYAP